MPVYMATAIAAIIGLGLIGMNFKIRANRIREEGGAGPYLVFLMIFVFSFLSNTNAFYSLFIEKDIVRETQDAAWEVFDRETSRALQVVEEHPTYQGELHLLAEVENEITKLVEQITDPNNLGMGTKAHGHLERIEGLLETQATELEPPEADAPARAHKEYAAALEAHIRTLMEERRSRGVVYGYAVVHEWILELRAKHEARIARGEYRKRHTDEMKRDLDQVENRINRHLAPTKPLALEEVNADADEVGKFKYTWRNFVEGVSPVAIALAVLLGALLDLIGPAMSIGLYRTQYD